MFPLREHYFCLAALAMTPQLVVDVVNLAVLIITLRLPITLQMSLVIV